MIDWIDHVDIPAAWSATRLAFWAMHNHPLYEGTIPAKLYETLACGVPVCAAHGTEGARMVAESDCGIIVPPADIEGLIHAIEDLIDDEARLAHYAQSARAYAENHLSAQIVAQKYEAILSSVIERKKL
jgi:glycosyltransferase involved in cell wall biosynthesis